MRKAKRALTLWSREAQEAYELYLARCEPAWRRALDAANTPGAAQANFEEDAIEKEAERLYEQRLRELGVVYD